MISKEKLRLEKLNLISTLESALPSGLLYKGKKVNELKKWHIEDLRIISKYVPYLQCLESLVTKMIDDKKTGHMLDENNRFYFARR